jgi:proline iminopeptidase
MPYLGYQTHYRIVGECRDGRKPLLLLHGGPGYGCDYLQSMDILAEDGRAVITYDQLGCGRSSKPSRPDLWHKDTWIDELMALRRHLGLDQLHLYGQSWGGMLAIMYLCDRKPAGITSLILADTLASAQQYGKEGRRLVSYLPPDMQDAIARAEATGNYDDPGYVAANALYMARHCFPRPENTPSYVTTSIDGLEAYLTAWGTNEFTPNGTLRDYEYREQIKGIAQPTLVISGLMDLSTPLVSKTIHDAIPNSRWELFEFSSHMPQFDEKEKHDGLLRDWLRAHD